MYVIRKILRGLNLLIFTFLFISVIFPRFTIKLAAILAGSQPNFFDAFVFIMGTLFFIRLLLLVFINIPNLKMCAPKLMAEEKSLKLKEELSKKIFCEYELIKIKNTPDFNEESLEDRRVSESLILYFSSWEINFFYFIEITLLFILAYFFWGKGGEDFVSVALIVTTFTMIFHLFHKCLLDLILVFYALLNKR